MSLSLLKKLVQQNNHQMDECTAYQQTTAII